MDNQTKTYKFFNIFSCFILIIAYVFIMVQSYINIIYNKNDENHIIAERLVYEEFAHEVYKNINSKRIVDIQFIEFYQNCAENYDTINLPIKIETFYDCKDCRDKDCSKIYKDICLNSITRESLCCKNSCCYKKVSEKKEINICSDKNNENIEDPREYLCTKFSRYNGRVYKLNNRKICVKRDDTLYEQYLESNQCKNYDCMVQLILSKEPPNYFEMESIIRLSLIENQIKDDEEKLKKEYEKIARISPKDIYDTFYEKKSGPNDCKDDNYIKHNIYFGSQKLNEIISNSEENIFYNLKDNNYYKNSANLEISLYKRNYIRFENLTEFLKFKKYFDSNDYKNNPLYKISKNLFPNYASLVFGVIICVIIIIYIVLLIKNFKKDQIDIVFKEKFNLNIIKFLLILGLFWIYLIIYLVEYVVKFEKIYIDMEKFYQKVLEKYNYRREQIYLLIGIIFFSFDIFIELLIQIIKCNINSGNPMNGPSLNSIKIFIKIQDIECRKNHIFKFFLKKKFSEHIPKIKKLLSKCRNCRESDIENFVYNENQINTNETIRNLNIVENSTILVE